MAEQYIFDGLTNENFFAELKEKYPDGMKHFNAWIDAWKEKVGWNAMHNASGGIRTIYNQAPKFHEIPFEMQLGVLAKYIAECIDGAIDSIGMEEVKTAFIANMEYLEKDKLHKTLK